MNFYFIDSGWVLLFTRLVLGVVMVYYGVPKIKDLRANAKDFVEMGFKPGWLWGTLVALLEVFGGALMILGFLAPLIAGLYGIQMIGGTIWKTTNAKKPFSDWSYDLQLLSMCLVIIAFGPGFFSLDFFL